MRPKDIVLSNIPLANSIAECYTRERPRDRDEILSAAYYGLVKAASLRRSDVAYVAFVIFREITEALRPLSSASRSDRAFLADYLNRSGNLEERAVAMGRPPEEVFHRLSTMAILVPLHEAHNTAARQESQLGEMLEVCLSFLPQRVHWTFLLKYGEEMNQTEIACRTGLHRHTVAEQLTTAIETLRLHKQELADILL